MLFWRKILSNLRLLRKNKVVDKNSDFAVRISKLVGYYPKNISIYRECFTHSSGNKSGGVKDNERLEFLGDSILSFIISDYLFHQAPDKKEGYLTQMRSKMVNRKMLNCLGKNLNLTSYLQDFKKSNLGENINGNLYESIVGAIYIDAGYEKCRNFIQKSLIEVEDFEKLEKRITSYKSLIIEWGQKNKVSVTFDTFQEENAEDLIIFNAVVRFEHEIVATGRATSKKKAEENAAKNTYTNLGDLNNWLN